jgi:hypothetical protein
LVVDAFICIVIVLGLGSFDPSLLLIASLVILITVALRASHCIARRQYRRWQSIKAQMRLSAQQNRQSKPKMHVARPPHPGRPHDA